MSSTSTGVDLSFRPATYFGALSGTTLLLSSIKGEQRRRAVAHHLATGGLPVVSDELALPALPDAHRRAAGRVHPLLMGGEYLPDLGEQELEIARIALQSTTGDVFSLYARRAGKRIHYRVVDEYQGEYLSGKATRTSIRPLTLGALVKFFLQAWDLEAVLEMNQLWNAEAQRFVSGSSQFYPFFGEHISNLITEWRTPVEEEEKDADVHP